MDPAFVAPARIASDGLLVCGAAARAVRAEGFPREHLGEYDKVWRKKVVAELIALRLGIGAFRRLTDRETDAFFSKLAGEEFSDEQFKAVLRGHPGSSMRKVGGRRSVALVATIAKAWARATAPR